MSLLQKPITQERIREEGKRNKGINKRKGRNRVKGKKDTKAENNRIIVLDCGKKNRICKTDVN